MPWYSWDKDFEADEPTADPDGLVIAGPVVAVSRRGEIGSTWWGQHWVAAMLLLGDTRLDRGRSYARSGAVRNLSIQKGIASAQVQGSWYQPYETSVSLRVFSDSEWEQALDALAAQAIYAAKLLAGEMPADIDSIFQAVGLSLFPRSRKDIEFDCSCPDWGDPCKHAAAIYYLLAEQFDADPFILFHLRGRTREQVLDGLRHRRGTGEHQEVESEGADATPAIPLDADLPGFWSLCGEMPVLSAPYTPSRPPLIAQLGAPPGGIEHEISEIYRQVSRAALTWLVKAGERVEDKVSLEHAVQDFAEHEQGDQEDEDTIPWNLSISEIPLLKKREKRLEAVLVDAYGPLEQLTAMEVYLGDALRTPFKALWRDPDQPDHEDEVTVLGVYGSDDQRGALLHIKRGRLKRRVEADQVWAVDEGSANAIVLDDYREWRESFGGLDDYGG